MQRNEQLQSLRTQIDFEEIQTNPNQLFQDKTLRPILKFQNEVVLTIYKEYIISTKFDFKNLSEEQINFKIEQSIKQNQALKALLKGVVIALFTMEELMFWLKNKEEINKRIIQLIIKRIQSQISPSQLNSDKLFTH